MGALGGGLLGTGNVLVAGEPQQTGVGGGTGTASSVVATFSGVSGDAGAPTAIYMEDNAGGGAAAQSAVPNRYPTSARTITKLWLAASTGTGANPPTATLFKNGVATTLTCTLGAGAAAGATVSATGAISFADGDTFDVKLTQPTAAEGAAQFTAALEGTGGIGGGFPGFDDLGQPVGQKNTPVNGQAAHADHGHATLVTTTATGMSALVVTGMLDGTPCYVTQRDAIFRLVTSTRTTNTWDTFASATAGRQWHRENLTSLKSLIQTTYVVDCANSTGVASDDNSGVDAAHPLLSMSELAYRWGDGVINTFISVSFLSNQLTTDIPFFRYQLGGSGFVQLTGVPTTIFTGTITAVATASIAAPTADDNTISCAGLAVSFTASGGLAKGVIYKKTNGAASYAFALKETVAKTIRVNRPVNAAGTGFVNWAINDTFAAQTLPRLGAMKFDSVHQWSMGVSFVDDRGVYADAVSLPIFFSHTYLSTARLELDCASYSNRCINAVGTDMLAGPGMPIDLGGAYIGTGASTYSFLGSKRQCEGSIYTQGCRLNANTSSALVGAPDFTVHAYDCTTDVLLADYWSFFVLGFVSGTGNTAKLLHAQQYSVIAYYVAGGCAAGSSTDVAPVQVGVTTVAAGTNVPLDVNGNGAFLTL